MEINAKKIIELISKLNGLIEGFDELFANKKNYLTNKDKIIIFLSEKPLTPAILINKLNIAKTNLALVCKELLKEDLIEKTHDLIDKRNISYKLTVKGLKKSNEILKSLSNNIKNQLGTKINCENINNLVVKLLQEIN